MRAILEKPIMHMATLAEKIEGLEMKAQKDWKYIEN